MYNMATWSYILAKYNRCIIHPYFLLIYYPLIQILGVLNKAQDIADKRSYYKLFIHIDLYNV